MTDKTASQQKKTGPPLLGLAVVADLWLWGAILLYGPTYLGIVSGWRIPLYVLGFFVLTISFAGALLELSKLWKSEGLNYWGVSLVFLIPAVALHTVVTRYALMPLLETIAKVATLLFIALGGAMVFHGAAYFLQTPSKDRVEKPSPEEAAREKAVKRRANLEIVSSILVALLSLATAVVKLVLEIIPQLKSGQP